MLDILIQIFDILIGFGLTLILISFKWYLEDTWFEKKDPDHEEENDYGYIE